MHKTALDGFIMFLCLYQVHNCQVETLKGLQLTLHSSVHVCTIPSAFLVWASRYQKITCINLPPDQRDLAPAHVSNARNPYPPLHRIRVLVQAPAAWWRHMRQLSKAHRRPRASGADAAAEAAAPGRAVALGRAPRRQKPAGLAKVVPLCRHLVLAAVSSREAPALRVARVKAARAVKAVIAAARAVATVVASPRARRLNKQSVMWLARL